MFRLSDGAELGVVVTSLKEIIKRTEGFSAIFFEFVNSGEPFQTGL
jgi:hypothetical protein